MKILPCKTKELIVYRTRSRTILEPLQPFIEEAKRVTTLRVLGVILNSRLTISEHESQVLRSCSSSTFALRLLRTHCRKSEELHLVARTTTIGYILYATPALWGSGGRRGPTAPWLVSGQNATNGLPASDFTSIETLAEADRKLLNF